MKFLNESRWGDVENMCSTCAEGKGKGCRLSQIQSYKNIMNFMRGEKGNSQR